MRLGITHACHLAVRAANSIVEKCFIAKELLESCPGCAFELDSSLN
jgi:hypothetical protein